MRHLSLLSCLLFALPCFATMPMPDVPRPEPEKSTACMRAYCDCNAFSLAQVPELGPASQACECGHSPAMHARELAPTFSGSTHASGSSAFTIERDMSNINTVRAKCRVTATRHANGSINCSPTQKDPYAVEVTLQPVYGAEDDGENKSWSKYTPSGELKLVITNTDAVAVLQLGRTFYVDFTPADALPG